jgi:hypothetical protein
MTTYEQEEIVLAKGKKVKDEYSVNVSSGKNRSVGHDYKQIEEQV